MEIAAHRAQGTLRVSPQGLGFVRRPKDNRREPTSDDLEVIRRVLMAGGQKPRDMSERDYMLIVLRRRWTFGDHSDQWPMRAGDGVRFSAMWPWLDLDALEPDVSGGSLTLTFRSTTSTS